MKLSIPNTFLLITWLHLSAIVHAQTSQYFISFDNTKIHYQIVGNGKPILFIHGFTNTLNNWKKKPLYDSLLKNGNQGGMGADFTNPNWPRRIGFYNALMHDSIPGYEGFRKYIAEQGMNPQVLASQQKEQPSTSKEQLAKLKQPVLVICGTDDADNGNGKDLQQMIPNSRFVSVPGNHNSASGTKEFASAILQFLH